MAENRKKIANATVGNSGVYVGPGWIRVDGRIEARPGESLTQEKTVHRAAKRNPAEGELRQSFYWFFIPAVIALACAARLFQVILEGLRP